MRVVKDSLFTLCHPAQVSTVPQERRSLNSTVPEGAESQAECLLVRQVSPHGVLLHTHYQHARRREEIPLWFPTVSFFFAVVVGPFFSLCEKWQLGI